MKNKYKIFRFIYLLILLAVIFSCNDLVEDGIRVDYPESDALLVITALPDTVGAPGDTISFLIKADALQDLKSFSVTPRYAGNSGTGYSYPGDDPFIDHAFGTIQKNTQNFEIIYNYVIPGDINQVLIEFVLTDELGKKSEEQVVVVVDNVVTYSNIELYTKNNYQADGFSTFNGEAYRNLKNYETVTEINRIVQENLDLVYIVDIDSNNAKLLAPVNSNFDSDMTIKNRTNLMLLTEITLEDFENLNPVNISHLVPVDSILGANENIVQNLKVGDFVGFITDYNATNSYKIGMLRVTSLHQSSCEWYEGTTFLIGIDVKVQVGE